MKSKIFNELAVHLLKSGGWGAAIETMPTGDHAPEVAAILRKTAVAGSQLSDLQGNLSYGAAVTQFIEDLRSVSVFDTLAANGAIEVPPTARVLAVGLVPAGHSRAGLDAGAAKNRVSPITRLTLAGGELDTDVVTAIGVFSRESLEYSGALDIVFSVLAKAVAAATDAAFLAWVDEQVGSDALEADSDTAVLPDIARLATEGIITGAERPYLILNPREARRAATKTDSDGAALHPDMGVGGGILAGIPALVTSQQTEGTVDLIDASGLAYADRGIELKPTTSGTFDMNADPDPDSPANFVSLFQTDSAGLGVFRHLGWRLARTAAVARMTGCDWL